MRTELFDFVLPEDRIALRPATPRDSARLLVVRPGATPEREDRIMRDLPALLRRGDAIVVNDTKVFPANLRGRRLGRGEHEPAISATLIKRLDGSRFRALVKPAKRLAVGDVVRFGGEGRVCFLEQLDATVEKKGQGEEGGEVTLVFSFTDAVLDQALAERGGMPLPPYIASRREVDEQDRADYQTMFAREEGSVAAPTAGLHFTDALTGGLRGAGIDLHRVTLHVGPGTFLPVKAADTSGHKMHPEWGNVSAETATALNATRRAGGRIVAVGSTSLRLLESAARQRRYARAVFRRDRIVHHARLPLPRRRCDADQLSSAALDAVHAGLCVLRPRCDAARLCACHRRRLPVLLLRRRVLAVPIEAGSGLGKEFSHLHCPVGKRCS